MRMTYDPVADAAYFYFVDVIDRGGVAESHVVDVHLDRGTVVVDFDADRRLLGIEVLGASRVLHAETLAGADRA